MQTTKGEDKPSPNFSHAIASLVVAVSLAFSMGGARAQTLSDQTAATVQTDVRDSIVQLTAEAQNLEFLSPSQVPASGTFWLVSPAPGGGVILPPLPCPPADSTLPVYQIAIGQYLVDGTIGQSSPGGAHAGRMAASAMTSADLEAEASAVVNLINQIQGTAAASQTALAMGVPSLPGSGGSGDGSTNDTAANFAAEMFNTNLLYLQITNVSTGVVYANLFNATNQVYAIWATTNLLTPFANWLVATEMFPSDTNCMPFTVSTLNQGALFLRAEDWTGVDSDGDGIPDWWSWMYWGTMNVTDTNLDYSANGNSLWHETPDQIRI